MKEQNRIWKEHSRIWDWLRVPVTSCCRSRASSTATSSIGWEETWYRWHRSPRSPRCCRSSAHHGSRYQRYHVSSQLILSTLRPSRRYFKKGLIFSWFYWPLVLSLFSKCHLHILWTQICTIAAGTYRPWFQLAPWLWRCQGYGWVLSSISSLWILSRVGFVAVVP
jgi:hypothetical protein